jgi:hypothetical protein
MLNSLFYRKAVENRRIGIDEIAFKISNIHGKRLCKSFLRLKKSV